jgi:hypothetical protein
MVEFLLVKVESPCGESAPMIGRKMDIGIRFQLQTSRRVLTRQTRVVHVISRRDHASFLQHAMVNAKTPFKRV